MHLARAIVNLRFAAHRWDSPLHMMLIMGTEIIVWPAGGTDTPIAAFAT